MIFAYTTRPKLRTSQTQTGVSFSYIIPLTIPAATKTRDFQFKFLGKAPKNYHWIEKLGIVDSDLCMFCGEDMENLLHLFWQCKYMHKSAETFITADTTE